MHCGRDVVDRYWGVHGTATRTCFANPEPHCLNSDSQQRRTRTPASCGSRVDLTCFGFEVAAPLRGSRMVHRPLVADLTCPAAAVALCLRLLVGGPAFPFDCSCSCAVLGTCWDWADLRRRIGKQACLLLTHANMRLSQGGSFREGARKAASRGMVTANLDYVRRASRGVADIGTS
jgi:hypothetical protein